MGAGVRRAGRRSELSQMEATSPTITAGLADATRLPSRLPLYGTDGSDDLMRSTSLSILQILRPERSLPHADTDRSDTVISTRGRGGELFWPGCVSHITPPDEDWTFPEGSHDSPNVCFKSIRRLA
jgi:hypothetical protein